MVVDDTAPTVKKEVPDSVNILDPIRISEAPPRTLVPVIDIESDDSSSTGSTGTGKNPRARGGAPNGGGDASKKRKLEVATLPVGFLDPLPSEPDLPPPQPTTMPPPPLPPPPSAVTATALQKRPAGNCMQFWKAGDYEGGYRGNWETSSGGMDHVRVHPKFLHSNATSHKWSLGAFAELLDNALDEVCNGATFISVDMLESKKDNSRMLLMEDNGGGMDPDKMRQCMSLGYSAKSKMANTIGQYGNGFKTSTMRLGADVIVFSRCCGQAGKRSTQSIGLLSYTFLRSTAKEDIVVPMLDYERVGNEWCKIIRSSGLDWDNNLETIVQWSPYASESELLQQFYRLKDHGTYIVIYNLWEDDEGQLELDFDANPYDIQIRGVNRSQKNIQMAEQYPNSRHFLTYRHSLRSYVSILYLRLPPGFRIIIRGKDVEHHNIVNDMMLTQEVTYRPQASADGVPKDTNMVAIVTLGFVKDAKFHIDVQGFNVYHKNRLIKPFWRLWNAAGSDGRGVIGVLEANFVEPAHDKQGFERTTVLSRLEARLLQMQKNYWNAFCQKIGYAPRRNKNFVSKSPVREFSQDDIPETSFHCIKKSSTSSGKAVFSSADKASVSQRHQKHGGIGVSNLTEIAGPRHESGPVSITRKNGLMTPSKSGKVQSSLEFSEPPMVLVNDGDMVSELQVVENDHTKFSAKKSFGKNSSHSNWSAPSSKMNEATTDTLLGGKTTQNATLSEGDNVEEENPNLQEREEGARDLQLGRCKFLQDQLDEAKRKIEECDRDLQSERDRCKSYQDLLNEAKQKIVDLNKDQETLIDIFSEERERREHDEENLRIELKREKDQRNIEEGIWRKKLEEASETIQQLRDKLVLLEKSSRSSQIR